MDTLLWIFAAVCFGVGLVLGALIGDVRVNFRKGAQVMSTTTTTTMDPAYTPPSASMNPAASHRSGSEAKP